MLLLRLGIVLVVPYTRYVMSSILYMLEFACTGLRHYFMLVTYLHLLNIAHCVASPSVGIPGVRCT